MAGCASPALPAALGVAPPAALAVNGFTPASAAAGATVTINGSGFDPDLFHVQVKFASHLTAAVVSSSATAIVVKVPAGAVTGPIEVINRLRAQTTRTSACFTVIITITITITTTTTTGSGGGTGAWVARARPSSFLLNGLAYGAGRFVAVGFNRAPLTLVDTGSGWRGASVVSQFLPAGATWTGSPFVAVGGAPSRAAAVLMTSPDGVSWTRRALGAGEALVRRC